jgi:hypothetical protein
MNTELVETFFFFLAVNLLNIEVTLHTTASLSCYATLPVCLSSVYSVCSPRSAFYGI